MDIARLAVFYRDFRENTGYEVAKSMKLPDGRKSTGPYGFAQKVGYQHAFSVDSLPMDVHRVDAHHFLCKAGPYSEGAMSCTDTFWTKPFEFGGETKITANEMLVWELRYNGIVSPEFRNNIPESEFYDAVLKPALRLFPRDKPWKRGPDEAHFQIPNIGKVVYLNACTGSMENCINTERIGLSKARSPHIYAYSDRGGLRISYETLKNLEIQ